MNPIQILPSSPNWGTIIGTGLGQGIGSGLSNIFNLLAQSKLDQMVRQQQNSNELPGLIALGFTPEQASQINSIQDPVIRREIIKQKINAPSQELYGNLVNSILGGEQNASNVSAPANSLGITPVLNAQELTNLAKLKQGERKISALENRDKARQVRAAFKDTEKIREEGRNFETSAKKDLRRISVMEGLNDTDKLISPGLYKVSEFFGIPLSVLSNPESEQYEKATLEAMGNVSQVVGGKATNYDIQQYLKTIPSLLNSKEGRRRILNVQRAEANYKLKYGKEMRKLIQENGGVPPFDLAERVTERLESDSDKLADQIKNAALPQISVGYKTNDISLLPDGAEVRGANGKLYVIKNGKATLVR